MILYRHIGRNDKGSILVVGMLTLVLLTVVGLAATMNGSLESEISGNEKSYQQAFYATEVALVAGETTVDALAKRAALNEGTTPGRYATGSLSFDHTAYQLLKPSGGSTQPVKWDNTDSTAVPTSVLSGVTTSPRYVLVERNFKSDSLGRGIAYGTEGIYYFSVMARGTGGSNAAHVLLESVYAKRF